MGIVEILGLVKSFFQFFPEIRKLIAVLQKTPEEKHAELMAKIEAEGTSLSTTGRPTW